MVRTLKKIKKNVCSKIRSEDMVKNFLYLSDVLYEKDEYTFEHCERVAYYCSLIGSKIGFSMERMEELILSALFHDIGKIAIPIKILNKQETLSNGEWKIVQSHPKASAKLLQAAGFSENAVSAIHHHHEWYNGDGYPNGLKGKEIPLYSRIISVADSYDAMTTDRSYSGILESDEALRELYYCKNSQFDPDIVDVFTDIIQFSYADLEAV
jgi:putative nucleotidyltransferase with HDIG domain